MRRLILPALALLLAACTGTTDEHAGHPTGATTAAPTTTAASEPARAARPLVTFPSANGEASGYLSAPSAPGRKPALIVVHEWWGLDNWIREQADRFAKQGYVALAPDLYRGRLAADRDEAHELSRGLPQERAIGDLRAAVDYLASRPDVDPKRIGVIGWCMGGGLALRLATVEPRISATVVNYGSVITDQDAIARINGEVLGNFGGADRGIPADDVKAFEQALTKARTLADIRIYPGAGHAFMNPNNERGYDAQAAQDAWARIDRFLDRTLRPTQ